MNHQNLEELKAELAVIFSATGDSGIWVKFAPARSLEQVLTYLRGDEISRLEISYYDGENFHNITEQFLHTRMQQ